jgi:hypothetical protein
MLTGSNVMLTGKHQICLAADAMTLHAQSQQTILTTMHNDSLQRRAIVLRSPEVT